MCASTTCATSGSTAEGFNHYRGTGWMKGACVTCDDKERTWAAAAARPSCWQAIRPRPIRSAEERAPRRGAGGGVRPMRASAGAAAGVPRSEGLACADRLTGQAGRRSGRCQRPRPSAAPAGGSGSLRPLHAQLGQQPRQPARDSTNSATTGLSSWRAISTIEHHRAAVGVLVHGARTGRRSSACRRAARAGARTRRSRSRNRRARSGSRALRLLHEQACLRRAGDRGGLNW